MVDQIVTYMGASFPFFSVEDCLLGHQFYHPASARCWALLEQGPCTPAQWLVTSSQEDSTGVAECRPRLGGG